MLSDKIKEYLSQLPQTDGGLELYKEEKEYAEKHGLLPVGHEKLIERDPASRFGDIYIERCDKESEKTISTGSSEFLQQPLSYLKKHKNEFIYAESVWFELINVDAVSIEIDDVFGTYDVMLGLQLQKKFSRPLNEKLKEMLGGDDANFELMFSNEDGLWDVNFDLNYVDGFHEDMSFGDAYQLIYRLLFKLVEGVEA